MAYADEGFYNDTYKGDTIDPDKLDTWLERASDEVDILTRRRLEDGFPTKESDAKRVKKAVCAIADALYLIDMQAKATSAAVSQGQIRTAVASISSGNESISFMQGTGASVYAKAAADGNEKAMLISEVAARFLADVPDKFGTNLLYAGW